MSLTSKVHRFPGICIPHRSYPFVVTIHTQITLPLPPEYRPPFLDHLYTAIVCLCLLCFVCFVSQSREQHTLSVGDVSVLRRSGFLPSHCCVSSCIVLPRFDDHQRILLTMNSLPEFLGYIALFVLFRGEDQFRRFEFAEFRFQQTAQGVVLRPQLVIDQLLKRIKVCLNESLDKFTVHGIFLCQQSRGVYCNSRQHSTLLRCFFSQCLSDQFCFFSRFCFCLFCFEIILQFLNLVTEISFENLEFLIVRILNILKFVFEQLLCSL